MSLTLAFGTEHSQPFLVFGEKIKGTIILENNETLKNCEYLKVVLTGHENVHWTETHTTHHGTGKDRRTTTHTTHYRNHRVLFEIPLVLWKSTFSKEDVQPGKYIYDFMIQVPFIPMSSSGKYNRGHIEYSLYSFLAQGNDGILDSVLSFFGVFKGIKVSKALNVLGSQITQQLLDSPQYYLKKIGSREKTFFLKWGSMCMTCTIQKTLFFDGEDIFIELVIQNGTSVKADNVIFDLLEKIVFRATNKTSYISKSIFALKQPMKIEANKRTQGAFKITLPKGLLETTIDPNCIVSRTYDFSIAIPCGITFPEVSFQIIIVNGVGCPLRPQISLKKKEEEIIQDDEFQVITNDIGILDDFSQDIKKNDKKVQPTAPKFEDK